MEMPQPDVNEIRNAQERTAAKIRYARLHLDELRRYERKGSGDDFERAHMESFLFHLFGTRDAFLQELNLYYGLGLELHQVIPKQIRDRLKKRGIDCPEFTKLMELENDPNEWLSQAKEMRDHSTHRRSVPRVFHIGGEDDEEVYLRHPQTGRSLDEDYADTFGTWCLKMEELLENLRKTALCAYHIAVCLPSSPMPHATEP